MLVKLVDKKTRVSTIIKISDDNQLDYGEGFAKFDVEVSKVKIVSIEEDVLCLPTKVFSEIKEGDLIKFFAEYRDIECLSELGIEAFGPMVKSIAYSPKEYDGYILENGKTVDRI